MVKRIILATAIVAFAAGSTLTGQGVDIQKLIQDTQKVDRSQNKFRIIWWMPTEYWEESFRNVPALTDDQKKAFYKAVDDYIVLCVVDVKISAFGSVATNSRDQIVGGLSLAIGQGKPMRPLTDMQVSSDAKNIFAMMKPVMANMLGQFGQGMEFVCFEGTDPKGRKLLDPKGKGSFSVHLGDSTYKWRLPLGSLLPPKHDPETGEDFPGNYVYNPFTGKKLVPKSSSKAMDSGKK